MDIIQPTWLGSFYGSCLSFEEYEFLTIQKIPADRRRLESRCVETRWFDYVRLHPLQATYWFAECYRRVYREYAAANMGHKNWIGMREDFLQTREAGTIWSIRQFCDLHGFEYLSFIRALLAYRTSTGQFKNYLPRPCHLIGSNEKEIEALIEGFKEEREGVLTCSVDPFFCVKNWCGDQRQIDHEDYLVNYVRHKLTKHFLLGTLIYQKQVLRFERACLEFPDEITDSQRPYRN